MTRLSIFCSHASLQPFLADHHFAYDRQVCTLCGQELYPSRPNPDRIEIGYLEFPSEYKESWEIVKTSLQKEVAGLEDDCKRWAETRHLTDDEKSRIAEIEKGLKRAKRRKMQTGNWDATFFLGILKRMGAI